jgi:hypothetical protein
MYGHTDPVGQGPHESQPNPIANVPNVGSFLNNQPDALIIQIYSVIKLYMFRASSLPIIHPDSAWKRSSQTYMKLTSTECTVENS